MNEPIVAHTPAGEQLDRLLGYLEQDPGNVALLIDAAEAAIDAGEADRALGLLDRAATITMPDARARNLGGLAAMHAGQFDRAATTFADLLDGGADDPALRFNLAWSRARLKDEEGALSVLDQASAEALPQAAALEVQLLHSLGRVDEAFDRGKQYLAIHPEGRALAAAMSVLSIDMGDEALAAQCAARAPGHPDALTTLGTLALGADRATDAVALFDDALARNPEAPRAWVGRGLAYLLSGKADEAPTNIDRGAAMFGDHLGSWIAAGWAYFVNGDLATSRARFAHALELDPTFAESHGSLAVLDLLAGEVDAARERVKIAQRLDRTSFSAALAQALLRAGDGDVATSRAIIQTALHTPIDGNRTIAQSLARLGMDLPPKG